MAFEAWRAQFMPMLASSDASEVVVIEDDAVAPAISKLLRRALSIHAEAELLAKPSMASPASTTATGAAHCTGNPLRELPCKHLLACIVRQLSRCRRVSYSAMREWSWAGIMSGLSGHQIGAPVWNRNRPSKEEVNFVVTKLIVVFPNNKQGFDDTLTDSCLHKRYLREK